MTARRILVVVAIAAIILAVALFTGRSPGRSSPAPRLGADGVETRYELRWTMRSDARATGPMADALAGDVHGEIELVGELAARRLDGGARLALRFVSIDRARIRLLDEAIVDDASAGVLVGREVVVELGSDGTVGALLAPAGTPAIVTQVMRAIALQLQVRSGPGAAYDATTAAVFGRALDRYTRTAAGLQRHRVRYETLTALPLGVCGACVQDLDGTAEIGIDPAGSIRTLRDREVLRVSSGVESVVVAENELLLGIVEDRAVTTPPPELAGWERIDDDAASALAERELQQQIAGDLTLHTLDTWIVRYAATGTPPLDPMWIAQAAAFLQLHPEHCIDLLAVFAEEGQTVAAQLMILDILVAAGTPQAQTALRGAVDLAASSPDRVYGAMLTRLGFVAQPTAETAAYVAALRGRVADRDATARGSALYTEGAMIGRLATVDRPAAVARARGLVAELGATDDPDQRAHVVTALGNADLDETLPAIVEAATDPAPAVRAAAATALRRRDGKVLVGLAADPDPGVQHAALRVLAGSAADADLARLAARVIAGTVPAGDDGTLVDALAPGVGRIAGVDDALHVILARHTGDLQLAAEIRALLG